MNFKVRRWRAVLRVLVLALIVAAVPLPSAGQASQPGAKPGIKASVKSIVRAVASETAAPAPARARAEKTGNGGQMTKADLEKRSFFKTPAGLVIVGIMGAGVGYAVYSASHDRVAKNANRQ